MYITTIIPLMRAYNLSFNEYAVLESIRTLSTLKRLDFWCVVSQQQMADSLGLSRRWMTQCFGMLEAKGLIERRKLEHTDTATRTTDEWNEWFSPINEKYLLYMKTDTTEIISGNVNEFREWLRRNVDSTPLAENATPSSKKCYTPLAENAIPSSRKCYTPLAKSAHNTNNNTNKDINNISKDILEPDGLEKKEYGKKEINEMILALKGKIGIQAFVDSAIERNIAKHCVNLMAKIGKDEFVYRLDFLLLDNFHAKNCNKILYVYNNIKGFIKPNLSNKTLVI